MNNGSGGLTAKRLHEVLDYDPVTGMFHWIEAGKGRVVNARAGRNPTVGVRYQQIKIDQVSYAGHRLAWLYVHGEWPGGQVDHINGDGFDNRIANIRVVSSSQNNMNRRSSSHKKYSPLKGVSRYKTGARPWTASIKKDKKSVHLGTFETAEEAHLAYQTAAAEIFGQYARSP